MKLSVPAFGAAAALVLAAAATPASAGASTGCWRHLGCAGAPAYGYAPPAYAPHAAYGYGHEHGYRGNGYRAARFYDHGLHDRPYPRRVLVKRIIEDDEEECRVIVKRRYNHFGDLVVKRIRVCD